MVAFALVPNASQLQVAVERVKEYSELPAEGPEYVEPRPPADWPSKGM